MHHVKQLAKKKAAEYCSTVSNLMCVLIKCKEILLLVIKSLRFKTLYFISETFFMSGEKNYLKFVMQLALCITY